MRFSDTPELAEWRTTVRSFLDQHWNNTAGDDETETTASMESDDQFRTRMKRSQAWLDKLGENGWIAPAWPKEYGGADMSVLEQFVLSQELTEAGAPTSRQMLNLVGPTIMLHGTDEQKAEHLPPMLRGEVAWCQGFSEPGSGSDLASLQTRAVRDGDDYVVNGQKIWTSGAHRADWMFMLARTDPDAPKHRGISYLLIDMKDPGVTVRPAHQHARRPRLQRSLLRRRARARAQPHRRGEPRLVRGHDDARLRALEHRPRRQHQEEPQQDLRVHQSARRRAGPGSRRPQRIELADRAVETGICELLSFQVVSIQASGGVPNMEASMNKMYGSELQQRLARTAMNITGMRGQFRQPIGLESEYGIQAAMNYMSTVPATIAAGTSEIQRNIIATRGLGLPRG